MDTCNRSKFSIFIQKHRGIFYALSYFCFVIFVVLTSIGTTWISVTFFYVAVLLIAMPYCTMPDKP